MAKTLLSEPISDESRWPPELILLREKFTAKSQLEIAQLQIKHEEEVSVDWNFYEFLWNLMEIHMNRSVFFLSIFKLDVTP